LLFSAGQDWRAAFGVLLVSFVVSFVQFGGVRSGLPSLGSGVTEPNRTRLNHQPQNWKEREVQASEGSNPSATASWTRGTPARRNLRAGFGCGLRCGLCWFRLVRFGALDGVSLATWSRLRL
jgi:hypothetical protein